MRTLGEALQRAEKAKKDQTCGGRRVISRPKNRSDKTVKMETNNTEKETKGARRPKRLNVVRKTYTAPLESETTFKT